MIMSQPFGLLLHVKISGMRPNDSNQDRMHVVYEGVVPECCPPLTTSPTVTSFTTTIPSTTPPVFVTNDHAGTPDAAMTPAPSPAPTVETTQESSTSGTVFENQCIVCPNGVKDVMNNCRPIRRWWGFQNMCTTSYGCSNY